LAKGSTPTIAVRYCGGRFETDFEASSGALLADSPGAQVQTWIGSSMFLKR